MIPWVREKFAERRARWIASRKRNDNSSSVAAVAAAAASSSSSSIGTNTNVRDNLRENLIHTTTTTSITTRSSNMPNSSHRVMLEQQRHKHQNHNLTSGKLNGKIKSEQFNQQERKFDKNNIREINIKIRSSTGREIQLNVQTSMKISELKEYSIQKFSLESYTTTNDIKELYRKYRFTRPDSQLEFNEQLTLDEAGIQNNETLNLCIKRTNNQLDIINLRAPTITDIALATLNQQQNENRPRRTEINEFLLQSDLQFDVRKVIISLAESSAYIIGTGPYAERLISMFKQKLSNKRKHQIDTLQCLVDMGFSRERAAYALKIENGIYSAALDWLIEHQNDEIQSEETVSILSPSVSKIAEINDSTEKIQALLEIIRIYSQRDIPPPIDTVNALIDMGFTEQDVLKALRMTRNNQAAACEWLCGNRSKSLTELRDGLSPESPILKAMMESPQVQMSLGNPKMFIAYLSMLENHNALTMWLGDSDTSSVLSHILRKYHEEKHILGINQLNSNNNNNNNNNSTR